MYFSVFAVLLYIIVISYTFRPYMGYYQGKIVKRDACNEYMCTRFVHL
jgi:hypothetical protein